MRDSVLQHMIYLERLKNSQTKEIVDFIDTNILADLIDQLRIRYAKIENLGYDTGAATTKRIEDMIASFEAITDRFMDAHTNFKGTILDIGAHEADWQIRVLNDNTPKQIDFILPTAAKINRVLTDSPFDGRTLEGWFENLAKTTQERLAVTIRQGIVEGQTVDQIVRRVQGTRATRYTDGILNTTRAQTRAVVHSAIQHASNAARQEVFTENADYLKGVQWVSTLDSHTCLVCAPLDGKLFPVNEGKRPPIHTNCLPADSLVSSTGFISAASKRWYEGDMVVIKTSSGNNLSATPNHPILTDSGWVSIGEINVGDNVISNSGIDRGVSVNGENKNVVTKIHEVFDSIFLKDSSFFLPMPTSSKDFHGDISNHDVAIITSNSFLRGGFNSILLKKAMKLSFIFRNPFVRNMLSNIFNGLCSFDFFAESNASSQSSFMRRFNLIASLLFTHLTPFKGFGRGLVSKADATLRENPPNDLPRNSDSISQGIFGHKLIALDDEILSNRIISGVYGDVFEDRVIEVKRYKFSGHVYNLQTDDSFFVANGIITHNCRCTIVPVTKSFKELGLDIEEIEPQFRASMNGQVPAKTTYAEWLKSQPKDFQIEVIGPTRAKLFRNGTISISQFTNSTGHVLTIDQLKTIH